MSEKISSGTKNSNQTNKQKYLCTNFELQAARFMKDSTMLESLVQGVNKLVKVMQKIDTLVAGENSTPIEL